MHDNELPPDLPACDPVGRAIADMHKAEHDLEAARTAEHRAEHELEEAIQELEEARHCETDIIVNSRERKVPGDKVIFEQIVELAFAGTTPPPPGQVYVYSMTYRHAASVPHSGELGPRGEVHVKEGTIFNVTRTVQS
ncbi:multiubiquitin domain-containing protein [Novosphingobium rosa]|uniref:multiubiquitin domain-containing protein n=1 Tax=Novosphingobium rosa TaxID=76978 RepID=UPI000834348D|nr:multiubiquitin domain-containing protein [Novosphingobium rosa]